MEFAILGPLDVRRDGATVDVRHGRQRILLISLLLAAGRTVPAEVLAGHVWEDRSPADPANALQVQVSRLRRTVRLAPTGPAPALRTRSGGYALDVEREGIDIHRFDRLVAAAATHLGTPGADSAEAARHDAAAAQRLWRGVPLQDVSASSFAGPEIERLQELRALALEYEVEAILRLGHHRDAAALLPDRIAAHPTRERLRAQLILALFRSGRQADALAAYAAARDYLVGELGVDPGNELREVHRRVLDHDPAWDLYPVEGATRRVAPSVSAKQLPAPTTQLVGREDEIVAVQTAVAQHRIVTLTGPGGVGKTRLALAVAHEERRRRPTWLVELAQVTDSADVPSEIARTLAVSSLAHPLDAVVTRIGHDPGLIVLDTCEHLLDACAEAVWRLARSCPELSVLCTSRQPLSVHGEAVRTVLPLGLPARGANPKEIRESDAVRLFVARGRAVRADFDVTDENCAEIVRICEVLDGLPLAIELAAARTRVLSVGGIVRRLDDRFTLLSAGRSTDTRHQSLRTAIEWSHDLLGPDERTFVERLGAFTGRFTFEGAAAVAAADLDAAPLDLISAAVDHSLVIAEPDGGYRMLDSLRAFAVGKLAGTAAYAATKQRMADWLVHRIEAADAQLRGPGQLDALIDLRAEVPNARSALDWCFTTGDPSVGVRLTCALTWFWAIEAANDEARRWLRTSLGVPGLDTESRARLHEGLGIHSVVQGDIDGGRQSLWEAVRQWEKLGTPDRGVNSLIYLGGTEGLRGDRAAAAALQDRAVELATAAGDLWGQSWAMVWRSVTAADQGELALASDLVRASWLLAQQVGDPRASGWIVHELSRVALSNGARTEALVRAEQAVENHESTGWNEGLTAALIARARARVANDLHGEALDDYRRASRIALELGQPYLIADVLEGVSHSWTLSGSTTLAAEALGAASAVRGRMGMPGFDSTPRGRVVQDLRATLRRRLGDPAFDLAFAEGGQRRPGDVLAALHLAAPG